MKKSESLKIRIAALNAEKIRIEAEMATAQREFVAAMNEESVFKPGDKVRFKNYPDDDWNTGIWGRYEIGKYRYDSPTIFKTKDDGTKSAKTHWVASDAEIIPA